MPLWISRGNASNMVPGRGMRTLKPSRFPVIIGSMSGAELPVAWVTLNIRKCVDEWADLQKKKFYRLLIILNLFYLTKFCCNTYCTLNVQLMLVFVCLFFIISYIICWLQCLQHLPTLNVTLRRSMMPTLMSSNMASSSPKTHTHNQ